MPEQRAGLLVGARAASGAIGIAVAVGVILAATLLPLPTVRLEPAAVTVVPTASAQQLVCPGAVLRLGDESGANATTTSAIGAPALTRGATSGDVESRPLGSTAAGSGLGAPVVLSVPTDTEAGLVGAQSQSVSTSDYSGFAASECSAPSSDAWIVGGSTAVGRTTLLTIANPGTVATTVSLEIFSEQGVVDAPGATGIVVAAGSQRVLSLAGLAPSLDSLAVHVTSRGGPVVAQLQQSVVRGIDPGGVDQIAATAAPATTQAITGVIILDTLEVQELLGGEGYDDLDPVLRVLVPGSEATEVTVRITPATPDAPSASFSLGVDAGEVTDVPLDDLEDGVYSIEVEADVPVATALRASTASGDRVDLAWFTAGDALTGDAIIAVAPGDGASVSLANTSASSITASFDGEPVTIPAGDTVNLPVDDGRTYTLTGGAGLTASVGYAGGGRLASYAISASAADEPPVVVYP